MKNDFIQDSRRSFQTEVQWLLYEMIHYILMQSAAMIICLPVYRNLPSRGGGRFSIYISLLIFTLTYVLLVHVYDGLQVSIHPLPEIIYSQFLAFLFADLFQVLFLWLVTGKIIPFIFLLVTLVIQISVAFLWSKLAIRIYYNMHHSGKAALVCIQYVDLKELIEKNLLEKKYRIEKIYNVAEILGDMNPLKEYETVFISDVPCRERNIILKFCAENHIRVILIPKLGDILMRGAYPLHILYLPLMEMEGYHLPVYYVLLKRGFDILVSLIGLFVLSPVFLVTAAAVHFTDGGPVFYRQERLTQNGRKFLMHKFRSMRVDAEKDGVARLSSGAADDRITPVGRVIRACRIDELPQLIDILRGDMSVVGPRPEREAIALQYEETLPEFRLRLLAKAGLTGYAQVYGKYNTAPYHKLQMDLMYIAHPSILKDLMICFATVKILFLPESTEGIAEGTLTAIGPKKAQINESEAEYRAQVENRTQVGQVIQTEYNAQAENPTQVGQLAQAEHTTRVEKLREIWEALAMQRSKSRMVYKIHNDDFSNTYDFEPIEINYNHRNGANASRKAEHCML